MGKSMNMNKNVLKIADVALAGLDRVGYELDMYGITSKVNRHNLIGQVLAGQKQIEGELDSLNARYDSTKVKVEKTISRVENMITNTLELALKPAQNVVSKAKGLMN
jgi:hypothetical protein